MSEARRRVGWGREEWGIANRINRNRHFACVEAMGFSCDRRGWLGDAGGRVAAADHRRDGPGIIERFHLCHDLNRGCIFGIELDRIEELSSGVRPARGVHGALLGSAPMRAAWR